MSEVSTQQGQQFYRAEELAALYRCHVKTLLKWARRGTIPAPVRLNERVLLWPVAVIEAHLAQLQSGASYRPQPPELATAPNDRSVQTG